MAPEISGLYIEVV